uniref:ADP-ribosyl cyclase/cyclic ADP-ribose hydrolase n=1 Tax=Chlamydomonas leiostraca TaxID=1034604 RepID=A0A7S0RZL4_9CHLO|mmetsp:Transcript_34207/g.86529  ORF Transcript_34207/g.86529 Transcript_34207/m.86529 type:complete len:713 (+) Transcript_34207:83-2221(+)
MLSSKTLRKLSSFKNSPSVVPLRSAPKPLKRQRIVAVANNLASGNGHVDKSLLLNNLATRSVAARVVASPDIAAAPGAEDIEKHLSTLASYWADGSLNASLEPNAVASTRVIHQVVQHAVNTKSPGLRGLQTAVISGSAGVQPLITLALHGHPTAYEALQILCYRNSVTCQQIAAAGIVEKMAIQLPRTKDAELQCAMLFLLTGLAAFSDATHEHIISSGMVPTLVSLCRTDEQNEAKVEVGHRVGTGSQTRAAAVLRNLAHNTKNHGLLINAGAVDVLADIMRHEKDPASRINAAVAVACLVGHEEGNPRLQLDESLVVEMLQVLDAACQGSMRHGIFWTVWKLCQGLASLTVNDRNKELIAANSGIEILGEVLFGKHHNNEAAHRFALSALWNLAFTEKSRKVIISTPGLVEAIRNILATTESSRTKEVAKGALWTLGLEQDVKSLHEGTGRMGASIVGGGDEDGLEDEERESTQHVMLSYEWGCQQSVMLIKTELQKAGYRTWMDIDKMSGSTLEAMARAVEESAVVLVCVSKRYKESQACRTEAEYAFQQRKKIIPVLMERDYKPSGWLGALMGTRLYFSMSDPRQIPAKMPGLIKELGDAGRLAGSSQGNASGGGALGAVSSLNIKLSSDRPESWTHAEVEDWLKRIKCSEFVGSFREKDMDGVALSGLYRMSADAKFIHETLASEFHMVTLGQRLRVIEELHRLFS